MTQSAQATTISPALAGPITNEILLELIQHARDLQNNKVTHEGGTLLVFTMLPLLEELLQHRQVNALMRPAMDILPANVVRLTTQDDPLLP